MTGDASLPPMTTERPRTPAPPLGWPLLTNPAATAGRMVYPSLARSIASQIEVVLRTEAGELLMRPEFGAGLARRRHEPNTLQTRMRMRDDIVAALARYEARIAVVSVEVVEGADPREVLVTIAYRCRFTQEPESMSLVVAAGEG